METEKLADLGISVVVLIPEEPVVTAKFIEKFDIPFVILNDADSQIIRQFGLFNETYDMSTKYYGSPYPGIFLVNAGGIITGKFAEESYKERPLIETLMDAAQALNAKTSELNGSH
jgi:peroxiredoxin